MNLVYTDTSETSSRWTGVSQLSTKSWPTQRPGVDMCTHRSTQTRSQNSHAEAHMHSQRGSAEAPRRSRSSVKGRGREGSKKRRHWHSPLSLFTAVTGRWRKLESRGGRLTSNQSLLAAPGSAVLSSELSTALHSTTLHDITCPMVCLPCWHFLRAQGQLFLSHCTTKQSLVYSQCWLNLLMLLTGILLCDTEQKNH